MSDVHLGGQLREMEFVNSRPEYGCLCGSAIGFYVVATCFTIFSKDFRLLGIILLVAFTSVLVTLLVTVVTWHRDRDTRQLRLALRRTNLTQDQINQLKAFKYSAVEVSFQQGVSSQTFDSTQSVCCICICDYELNDDLIELSCGHVYHKCCISNWLLKRARCPTCKAVVIVPDATAAPAVRESRSSVFDGEGNFVRFGDIALNV